MFVVWNDSLTGGFKDLFYMHLHLGKFRETLPLDNLQVFFKMAEPHILQREMFGFEKAGIPSEWNSIDHAMYVCV